jgi:CheY-like chemotaxis protein
MHGRRILIAEDSYLVAAELADLMVEHGAVVLGPVGSIEAALEILREQPVDGGLLDVLLSDGNCTAVAAALHELDVPFVVVTGYSRSTLPPGLQHAPYLGKPTTTEDLLEVCRRTFRPS